MGFNNKLAMKINLVAITIIPIVALNVYLFQRGSQIEIALTADRATSRFYSKQLGLVPGEVHKQTRWMASAVGVTASDLQMWSTSSVSPNEILKIWAMKYTYDKRLSEFVVSIQGHQELTELPRLELAGKLATLIKDENAPYPTFFDLSFARLPYDHLKFKGPAKRIHADASKIVKIESERDIGKLVDERLIMLRFNSQLGKGVALVEK